MEQAPVIVARGVTKVFGSQRALDGIDLVVPQGVVLGIIGPSGCGKTTLVRSMTGIETPTEGEVRVFDKDPTRFRARERTRFGYMPQMPVLFPNLTVWGNLGFMASVYGVPMRGRKQRLLDLLELVDLVPHRHKLLSACSGGMQRRLALAATLVHDPELLYLDEPTAGVDPILRERFWGHFRSLRSEGKTIVVPTQYVGEAVSCDVVAVMVAGRLVTVLPPEELPRMAYGGDPLSVQLDGGWVRRTDMDRMLALDFVTSVERDDDGLLVVVDDASRDAPRIRENLAAADVTVSSIEPSQPTYDAMFVRLVERYLASQERQAA